MRFRCPAVLPSTACEVFIGGERGDGVEWAACITKPAQVRRGFTRAAYIIGMIRLTISAAAFEAIAATLPSSIGYERIRAPSGEYHIWLEPRFVDRLRAMRGPGASYGDVILRLAKGQ